MKMSRTTAITAATGATLAVVGAAIGTHVARRKIDEFMGKSVVLQVADDAPDVMKLALRNLRLSIKIRELYDHAAGRKPAPKTNYFKVTIQ